MAEKIKSQADAKVTVIVATANQEAAVIKAEGNKKAAIIYAKAYQSNPGFYALYRSLEAYNSVFTAENKQTLVLHPSGSFFNYFNSINGAGTPLSSSASH